MDSRQIKPNKLVPTSGLSDSAVHAPETPARSQGSAGVFRCGVTKPAGQGAAAVTPRDQFPEFAAFVDAMRATFGEDVQAALHRKPVLRWLRCGVCARVFRFPGRPEDVSGVWGVGCTCGHIVGLNGRRWVGSASVEVPVLVTPGLSAMSVTHGVQP